MTTALGGLLTLLLLLGACAGGVVSTLSPEPLPTHLPTAHPPTGSPLESESPETAAPETPSPEEAYQFLLATIPEPVRSSCVRFTGHTEAIPPEPGELAEADCDMNDGPYGQYVSYKQFDSAESMNAFYDIQLRGMQGMGGVDGPGCFAGQGAGTWQIGRRFCYQVVTDDANVRWTHDLIFVVADAIQDDGDWAALGRLWAQAGPVSP